MITYKKGNLLSYRSITNVTVIAHSANNKGAMGSGVAKAIINDPYRGKAVLADYKSTSPYILGDVIKTTVPGFVVLTIIGQDGYGYDGSKYVDYEALKMAFKTINLMESFDELAMPKIGAGLGGGDWSVIEQTIIKELTKKKVIVYEL